MLIIKSHFAAHAAQSPHERILKPCDFKLINTLPVYPEGEEMRCEFRALQIMEKPNPVYEVVKVTGAGAVSTSTSVATGLTLFETLDFLEERQNAGEIDYNGSKLPLTHFTRVRALLEDHPRVDYFPDTDVGNQTLQHYRKCYQDKHLRPEP